jgi:hypothetical protein
MHWPDPAQRPRIAEIRSNLIARIAEAEREGWLGEVESLKISLAAADDKLAQVDQRSCRQPVDPPRSSHPSTPVARRPAVSPIRAKFLSSENPQGGHDLRPAAGADLGGVLGVGGVADVVQGVG